MNQHMFTHRILMAENLVWDSNVRVGSHHYATQFIKRNHKIFWLSLPWNIVHLIAHGSTYERIVQWNHGIPNRVSENLTTFCPLTLTPYRNNLWIRNERFAYYSLQFTFPSIIKILEKSGFSEVDVLWITDPRMIGILKYVKYRILVYRCVDDFANFSDIPPSVTNLEKDLVKRSDVIFATAPALVNRLKKIRSDINYLPNGVDFEHFYNINKKTSVLDDIPHPRIIYVGTLGEWFDCQLIRRLALSAKELSFVLIGPVRTDISMLESLPNIHILGPKDYKDIPHYLKCSDVGFIPFKVNALTDAVNPIKLYEYLAAGLPVVASNIEGIRNANAPVILAENDNQFLTGFREVLKKDKSSEKSFQDYARDNSWDSRFSYACSVISQKGVSL